MNKLNGSDDDNDIRHYDVATRDIYCSFLISAK